MKMRKKRLFLWIPLALVLLLAGGVVWLFNADLGRFSGRIETELTSLLGRELHIDGELHLHLGRKITLDVRMVRIENPGWAQQRDFVTVSKLTATIDLASVFEPPVIIESLSLDGVTLWLEKTADGESTWTFGQPGKVSAEAGDPDVPDKSKKQTSPVLFRHITLRDFAAGYTDSERETPVHLSFDSLTQDQQADGMLALAIDGMINGSDLAYDGTLGPFDNLIQGQDVQYRGKGQFGSLEFTGEGRIDTLFAPQQPIFDVSISGPDLIRLTQTLELDQSIVGAYDLRAKASIEQEGWHLEIKGNIGPFLIELASTTAAISDFSKADFNLEAQGPDMGAIMALFGLVGWPAEPFKIVGDFNRDGEVLDFHSVTLEISDATFDLKGAMNSFPHFKNSNLNLDVQGSDIAKFRQLLGVKGVAEGAFSMHGELKPGQQLRELVEVTVTTSLGTFEVSGTLTPDPKYVGSRLRVSMESDDISVLLAGYGLDGFPQGHISLDANLEIQADGIEFETGTKVVLPNIALEVDGLIGYQPLESGTDISLIASGENIVATLEAIGLEAPLQNNVFHLKTGFRATPAGFRLDALDGNIGDTKIQVDGLISRSAQLAGLDLTLSIQGALLTDLLTQVPRIELPATGYLINAHIRRIDDTLRVDDTHIEIGTMTADGQLTLPWPLRLDQMQISAKISGPDLSVPLPRAGDYRPGALPFLLDTSADVVDGAWTFSDTTVELAEARAELSGTIDRLPDLSHTSFKFDMAIPDPAGLGTWRGQPLPDVSLNLKGQMRGSEQHLDLEDLDVKVGATDLQGSISMTFGEDVPNITVRAHSDVFDVRELMPVDETSPDEKPPPEDGRIIPDIAFPLDQMKRINATVQIEIGTLHLRERTLDDFALDGSLLGGVLDLKNLSGKGVAGDFSTSGSLTPRDDGTAALEFNYLATDLLLNRDEASEEQLSKMPRFSMLLESKGEGAGLRDFTSSMNGRIRVAAVPGQVPDTGMGLMNAYVLEQLFSTLIPGFSVSQELDLQCLAAALDIKDGLIESAPAIAVRTDKFRLLADGTIDLKDETLDFSFQTTPTKALGASLNELVNPFVKIGGTLAAPQPNINATGTLLYGGAAAATGGLSILAKAAVDRLSGMTKPCDRLLEEISEERKGGDENGQN